MMVQIRMAVLIMGTVRAIYLLVLIFNKQMEQSLLVSISH